MYVNFLSNRTHTRIIFKCELGWRLTRQTYVRLTDVEFHYSNIKNRLAPLQNGTFIRWDCCYRDKKFGRPAAVAQNWFILKTAEQTVSSNYFTYQVCTSVRKIYLMSPKARLRTGDTPTQEVKAFWMNSNKPDSASRGWAVGFFYRLMMIDHDWW